MIVRVSLDRRLRSRLHIDGKGKSMYRMVHFPIEHKRRDNFYRKHRTALDYRHHGTRYRRSQPDTSLLRRGRSQGQRVAAMVSISDSPLEYHNHTCVRIEVQHPV